MQGPRTLSAHAHPHEQIGYLVTGRLYMSIGGEVYEYSRVTPGASLASRTSVEVVEDSVVIEVILSSARGVSAGKHEWDDRPMTSTVVPPEVFGCARC